MSDLDRDDAPPPEPVALPDGVEDMLRSWPVGERPGTDWDEFAERIVARAAEERAQSVDDGDLAAPFPREENEPGAVAPAPSDLANIARAAVGLAGRGTRDADIAMQSLSVAARARQEVANTAPREAARPAPESQSQPRPAPQEGRAVEASQIIERQSGAPKQPAEPTSLAEQKRRRGSALVLIAGALAAAAVLVVVVRSREAADAFPQSSAESHPVAAAATPAAAVPPGAHPAQRREPALEAPAAVALDDLPTEAEAQRAARDRAASEPRTAVATLRPVPAAGAVPKVTLAEKDDGNTPMDLLARQSEQTQTTQTKNGPSDPDMRPAADEAVERPERPSNGAVQAAVASVMANAQTCLAGQTESARATLTFGSSGKVSSVAITGPVAGTPAEGCLRSKLMRASVSPFADPTFSAKVTVHAP